VIGFAGKHLTYINRACIGQRGVFVGQYVVVRIRAQQLGEQLRCTRGWQQVGLPSDDRSAECDKKVITLRAQIECVARLGQACCEREHIGEEFSCADLASAVPREDAVEVRVRKQRNFFLRVRGSRVPEYGRHRLPLNILP